MTREQFLTVRWNTILTVALGLPGLLFWIFALSSSTLSDAGELIGLGIIGIIF